MKAMNYIRETVALFLILHFLGFFTSFLTLDNAFGQSITWTRQFSSPVEDLAVAGDTNVSLPSQTFP
jgi:hypothetical protein